MSKLRNVALAAVRLPISAYKYLVSPFLPVACRFTPTCSEYASQALRSHGFWRGGLLALKRICRCHPWGGEGFDPPPAPHRHDKCFQK